MVPSTDGLRLGPCWQVQTAALQVALQLLSTLQPARLPFHSLLDAAIRALQSWVDHDGAFMDHPLYPAWSQRLLAVLHILWKASWPWGAQDIARQKITKASRHPICLQMHSYRQQAYTAVLVQHCCCFSQEVFVRCSLRVPWAICAWRYEVRCKARYTEDLCMSAAGAATDDTGVRQGRCLQAAAVQAAAGLRGRLP